MKTERRHELQTNVLADWLGDKIQTVKPYSRAVLGGLIALAVILGVYFYLSRQRAAVAAAGWDLYFKAWEQVRTRDNTEDLSDLAQSPTYRDTAAGMWARIALADHNYARGENHLFSDRAQAKQELKIAVDSYASVANQSEYPLLAQRALLGKARALESLDDQDAARKAYQALADEADGLYQNEAKKRLADLSQDATKQFYDWFALENPPPQSQFAPGIPGMRPDFDLESLKSGASLFDQPPPGDSDSSSDLPLTPATGPPATGQPATGAAAEKDQTAPASATDAGKKPAETQSAAKPADTTASPPDAGKKPAEGTPAATPSKDGGKK
jgi:hypothetical protein